MIRSRALLFGLLACLLTATLLVAGSSPAPSSLTVGDFAVMIASKISPDGATEAITPVQAAEILKKSGVKIETDLASPLTEGEAAGLFRQLGVTLQAQRPGDLLGKGRAEALIGIFGTTLASNAADNDGVVLKSNSGKTTTAPVSIETTPLDCQSLPRPPAPCSGPQSVCNPCMDCCKNQLGLTGKTCGRLCQKRNLVSSPTEPTP